MDVPRDIHLEPVVCVSDVLWSLSKKTHSQLKKFTEDFVHEGSMKDKEEDLYHVYSVFHNYFCLSWMAFTLFPVKVFYHRKYRCHSRVPSILYVLLLHYQLNAPVNKKYKIMDNKEISDI